MFGAMFNIFARQLSLNIREMFNIMFNIMFNKPS